MSPACALGTILLTIAALLVGTPSMPRRLHPIMWSPEDLAAIVIRQVLNPIGGLKYLV